MLDVRPLRGWLLRGEWTHQFPFRTTADRVTLLLVIIVLMWSGLLTGVLLHTRKVIEVRDGYQLDSDELSVAKKKKDNEVVGNDPNGGCIKRIHIFGDMSDMRQQPELASWYELLERSPRLDYEVNIGCRLSTRNCTVKLSLGTDLLMFRNKDAVIFGVLPMAFKGRMDMLTNLNPEPEQTWFFYSTESPHRIVLWNQHLNISRLKYHKMMSYRWDSHINLDSGRFRVFKNHSEKFHLPKMKNTTQSHLISWMDSNCYEVFWPRKPFLSRLRSQLPLHEYGNCGTKQCLPRHSEKCAHVMQGYKFQLILGNAECYDLIPADFWSLALANDVVPVVYGVPKYDVERVAPPNSYIHISDFKSPEDLARYLKSVGSDPEKYSEFFEWKRFGQIKASYPIQPDVICRTIPHLYDGTPQLLSTVGVSTWYSGCRQLPGRSDLKALSPDQQYKAYNQWSVWKVY